MTEKTIRTMVGIDKVFNKAEANGLYPIFRIKDQLNSRWYGLGSTDKHSLAYGGERILICKQVFFKKVNVDDLGNYSDEDFEGYTLLDPKTVGKYGMDTQGEISLVDKAYMNQEVVLQRHYKHEPIHTEKWLKLVDCRFTGQYYDPNITLIEPEIVYHKAILKGLQFDFYVIKAGVLTLKSHKDCRLGKSYFVPIGEKMEKEFKHPDKFGYNYKALAYRKALEWFAKRIEELKEGETLYTAVSNTY